MTSIRDNSLCLASFITRFKMPSSKKLRFFLTKFSRLFFEDYCWINHDIRYFNGGNLLDKIKADFLFFKDLIKSLKRKHFLKKVVGSFISVIYFISVLLFGFFSFNFQNRGQD